MSQYARRLLPGILVAVALCTARPSAEVIEQMPPPIHHGRHVRIHYISQVTARPPTFVLWANTAEGLSPSYKRFIANRLRERYGFKGTPIRIAVKARKDRHKPEA